MITLEVDGYCHDCPHFKADVDTNVLRNDNGCLIQTNTTIRCANREKCKSIAGYLFCERSADGFKYFKPMNI